MLQQAEALVETQARQLITEAQEQADLQLRRELERLEALKAVNPNIREDELTALENQREQVLSNLHEANWRLDAIRLVVVSHQ
jgi:ATP-dependent helicase HepA